MSTPNWISITCLESDSDPYWYNKPYAVHAWPNPFSNFLLCLSGYHNHKYQVVAHSILGSEIEATKCDFHISHIVWSLQSTGFSNLEGRERRHDCSIKSLINQCPISVAYKKHTSLTSLEVQWRKWCEKQSGTLAVRASKGSYYTPCIIRMHWLGLAAISIKSERGTAHNALLTCWVSISLSLAWTTFTCTVR